MNKLLLFFRKLNNPITYASAMCLSGAAFIALPSRALDVVILIYGALISLVAICLSAAWALAPDDGSVTTLMRHGALVKSSLMLVFGISLMLVRSSVSRSVCATLGILLALYSIFRLSRPARSTLERGASWYVEGVILVLLILLGATVAIIPMWPKITAGVALLAFGLKPIYDIVSDALKRRKRMLGRPKGARSRPRDIFSDDFIDKSDGR